MERQLTVLLVEDDPGECALFAHYVESVDDVRLVWATDNAVKALELTKDHLPDAVILDLELHKGRGSGVTFLTELGKTGLQVRPYILVTTHNISRTTHAHVRQLGADFIMVKSQEDYSAGYAVEFLRSLKGTIQSTGERGQAGGGQEAVSPDETRRRMEQRVVTEMDLIGLSPKPNGYLYIIDAIMHVMDGYGNYIVYVAQKYGKSDSSVERAMQNAINSAWREGDIDDLLRYYTARISSAKGVPTLKEFIKYYAYKINREYMAGVR